MDQAANKPFIGYLHSFRGVAILCIMAAHAWSLLGYFSGAQARDPDYIWLYAATESLFHGTTLFFALISGVLVTRVLGGMPWSKFFRNKFSHVLVPYIVVTTVLTLLAWPDISAWIAANNRHDVTFPMVLAHHLATGQAAVHLWYVPVLMGLFVLTPLLRRLLRIRHGVFMLALALVPLVVSRTVYPELLSIETLVYFLGAYGFGMYLGERLDDMLARVRRHRMALVLVFVASLALNFLLFRWEYTPSGITSSQQILVYINKMVAALLLLEWLHVIGTRVPRVLDTLGTYAFSLYFLHFSVMWLLVEPWVAIVPDMGVVQMAWAGLVVYAVAVCITLLASMGLKRLFGRYSRVLIGS